MVSRSLLWPPVLNGHRPAFLRNLRTYDGARYRVFYRPYAGSGAIVARDLARAGRPPGARRA